MKFKFLIVFLILLGSVGGAYGFEDSVQRYVVNYEEVWDKTVSGTGSVSIVNSPALYPTSNGIQLYAAGVYSSSESGTASIKTIDIINSDYFSFTVNGIDARAGGTGGDVTVRDQVMYLNFYNTISGSILATVNFGTVGSSGGTGRYELVRQGSTASYNLFINGLNVKTFSLSENVDEYKIEISVYDTHAWYSLGTTSVYIILDDFSTSSIIGMNEEWTQASTYIDTSYGIQSYLSFPSSVYAMTSKNVGTGTTINTTTLTSQADFVRWNRTEIYGTNWGLYHVQLFRDSTKMAETTFTYFDSTISGSVAYDSDSYSQGQTANIAYTISSADFATYTYYLKTMNVAGTVQDTYTLSASSGTKSPTLADYDSGVYYAILSRTSKASGTNEEFAYDYASVTESVYINGNVTEAVSGTSMNGVSISYLQGSTYYNTTSAADGSYNISDLSVAVSTSINADVTYSSDAVFGNESYNLSTFSFTPLAAEIYQVDLILFDINHTYDNVSAYGLIYDSIYHQPIESATVNIYNDTWSDSTTSTATGYYVFNDLIANGTYSINATSTGYTDTIDYSINTTTINATRKDVPMSTLYTVTIKAKDATTLAYLSDFTATLDGVEGTAVNGTVTFSNIEYGLHAVSAIADNYYPSATTPLIDEDTEVVLSLTRLSSQYYAPHNVKFTLKSLFGTRYSGVTTNVYLGASASGDVEKTGTTGTDGAIAFELSEDVQYTLTFIDATQGISKTITLYPKNDDYTVYIFTTSYVPDDTPLQTIQSGITSASINLTAGNINASFNDSSATFTHANFTIRSENGTTLYAFTTTDTAKDWSQTVSYNSTTKYTATIEVFNTALTGGKVMKTAVINFNYGVRPEYDFGWTEQWQYQLLGACLMLFIGGLFSAGNAHLGAVIVVGIGWFNLYAGWFPRSITAGLMMLLGTLIAIAFAMRKQENKI